MGSKPPKFSGSPNIFLTKYQPSDFLCLLFAEKIDFLLVNQQKNSQWKLVNKNLVKRIFGGTHEWVTK
jgi:hypothetical protein